MLRTITAAFALLLWLGCDKTETPIEPKISFTCKFNASQERLNNTGAPAVVPSGHATQTPDFKAISLHYIELIGDPKTQVGGGAIVFQAPETTLGGENAVWFDQAERLDETKTLFTLPVKDIPAGTYEWVRVSVTYQELGIKFNIRNIEGVGNLMQQSGLLASFVGFNTYLTEVSVGGDKIIVDANRKQGFWLFKSQLSGPYANYSRIYQGQAPAGSTTVVNPLFGTSPVPPGSCLVTGKLTEPLTITGAETNDIPVVLSFSINNSVEWKDDNGNKELDFYGQSGIPNEKIVDMGLRGLKAFVNR
jgi:hypothetical protein